MQLSDDGTSVDVRGLPDFETKGDLGELRSYKDPKKRAYTLYHTISKYI